MQHTHCQVNSIECGHHHGALRVPVILGHWFPAGSNDFSLLVEMIHWVEVGLLEHEGQSLFMEQFFIKLIFCCSWHQPPFESVDPDHLSISGLFAGRDSVSFLLRAT